jgi:transcriptional regulator GlxA family with amidase domain
MEKTEKSSALRRFISSSKTHTRYRNGRRILSRGRLYQVHYAEPIAVETLVHMTHFPRASSPRVQAFFQNDARRRYPLTRVNAARDMLEHSTRLITDIAQAVGFYDQSHFIRTFKRFRGITPAQYAKASRGLNK